MLPLRHFESGAQLISANGCRFAWGSTVEQCLSYAAFDRIGTAQLLSRAGIALDGGTDALLGPAKGQWMENADLQPLRKYTEQLLVEQDWAIAHLGLDLVDQLIYGLLYSHLDEAALMGGAGAYSLMAQHLSGWFTDHRRWVDALYKAWQNDAEHGAANRAALAEAAARLLPAATEAALGVARIADSHLSCGAVDYVTARAAELADTLVLVVKPQDMEGLLAEIRDHIVPGNLVVSMAAGIPTSWLEQRLPARSSVVRVMPNTPALVDQGMAAISAGSNCTAGQRVSATNRPKKPPTARKTTAATALARISNSALRSMRRPVNGQVRYLTCGPA